MGDRRLGQVERGGHLADADLAALPGSDHRQQPQQDRDPSALNTLASSAPRSSSSGADVSGPQQGLCRCGRPGHRRRRACCGPQSVEIDENFGSTLYAADERAALPAEAVAASPGCGNPTAVAGLRDGERVFDLGSGGGIDVPLSARRVGPNGKAYGLDMTDEMLTLASPT